MPRHDPLGPDVGSYDEYGERWARSILVVAFWIALGVLFIPRDLASYSDCSRRFAQCGPQVQILNQQAAGLLSITGFVTAAIFIWRRVFRHPGVRIGDVGFEDHTQVFRVHRVAWRDVQRIYPVQRFWFWLTMNVALSADARREGSPASVTVRVSGLTKPAKWIAAEFEQPFRAHQRRLSMATRRLTHLDSQALHGARLVVGPEPSATYEHLSGDELWDLLWAMSRGRSFAVLDKPGSSGAQQFIQMARSMNGSWHVEYRDGGPDRHFAADCDDIALLEDVLISWAEGSEDYRTGLPWERVDINPGAG